MQDIAEMARHYMQSQPFPASAALSRCSIDDTIEFLRQAPVEVIANFLPHISTYIAVSFLNVIEPEQAQKIFQKLDKKLKYAYVGRLEDKQKNAILNLYTEDQRELIASQLSYLPNTAGHLMDTTVPPIKAGSTVGQVLDLIRKKARILYYLYIVDEKEVLIGVLTLRKLIQEPSPTTFVEDLIDSEVACLFVDDDNDKILENERWNRFAALPVVDYSGKYLGVIRHETYSQLRASAESSGKTTDLDAVSHSLGELYRIGFSALVGSTSSLLPDESSS